MSRALVFTTLMTTIGCLFAFGVYSVKSFFWKIRHQEATFPGAGIFYGSPAQVTEKYENHIYPAPWAISIIWPVVLFWNISAMVYMLFQKSLSLQLPPRLYVAWAGAWLLTTVWTFLFDAESHIATLLVVLTVVILSGSCLRTACKIFYAYEKNRTKSTESKTDMNHPFLFLVVESLAFLTMWSVVAFAISIAYALAYKNSLHSSEAILTGLLTPEESATMGAIFILLVFTIWWTLDIAYWGMATQSIRFLYPAFCLVMLSLGISNYSTQQGMSLNNALCFGTSVISLVAMLSRKKAKDICIKRLNKKDDNDGCHLDKKKEISYSKDK
ncbi:uncharacterized protein LOC120331523 [Styela clava]|uniref:uncharacterized protein LOC120331523 n=1 Tax=Styela clava TaxID=7725 RepID=UPI00193A3800|nr:uncharacterized protein LOC120331523 [Styela clava]